MTLIYADDEELGKRVAAAVRGQTLVVRKWMAIQSANTRAHTCVIALDSLGNWNLAERLGQLRRWTAHAPIVLVLPMTEEHATALAAVVVEGVIWTHRLSESDYVAERLGAQKSLQARFAAAVLASERIPNADRELIARLIQLDPPPRTCEAAARMLGTSPSTLCRKVSTAFGNATGFSTGRLLETVRLLWCCDPLRRHHKPQTLARLLGRSSRSLFRIAQDLTGTTLGELRRAPERALYDLLGRLNIVT